jgi:putative Holliday junction resolvase
MRYLGIDYGSKKIGIALSDASGTMGFPHSIVLHTPNLVTDISAIITREGAERIVIGESLNFAGAENPIALEAKKFAAALSVHTGIAIAWEPEMMTTQEARRAPGQADAKRDRKPRDHSHVDASAAALILTSYLSKQRA